MRSQCCFENVTDYNILYMFLCVCFQDWEFPHFMGDLEMNLPGMSTTHVKVKLPVCKRIFKDEYHIHITGAGAYRKENNKLNRSQS